jgi:hypothetical protein
MRFLPSFVYCLLLTACDGAENSSQSLNRIDPLTVAKRVDQIPTITKDLFTQEKADCTSQDRLIASMWAIDLKGLSQDQNPHLVGWGSASVRFADDKGQLFLVRRQFEPGDPGVTTTLDDLYLISSDCRLLVWDIAQDVS